MRAEVGGPYACCACDLGVAFAALGLAVPCSEAGELAPDPLPLCCPFRLFVHGDERCSLGLWVFSGLSWEARRREVAVAGGDACAPAAPEMALLDAEERSERPVSVARLAPLAEGEFRLLCA